ncbi:HSPA5 [Mytilus coruscus]|uniref:HSPA5 n=1 Tax=Mytilus coruscus TaxID=42192 RepID=A0A6J8BRS7_MYTCO|nr:HSPA5 [Mytilus coruscus]
MFLASMKQLAEQYIDGPITDAVITTPAYFNEAQRQATKDAGAIAGLNVRRILSEPTAASMAFSTDSTEVEQMVFVLDLGGGTVDASIIQYNAGFYKPIATVGNTDLGGEDFNERIYSEVIRQYQRTNWKKFPGWRVKRKVLLEIEKAKRELSFLSETIIEINSIYPGEDFSWKLTREHFDFICSDLFLSIIALIKRALKFAEMEAKDITHIVLVGGSSKMVLIKSLISNYFGKSPNSDINPDEAIVYGAAVQAGFLSGDTETNDMLLHDIYPMTLGIKIDGGEMAAIIKRNTPIPYHNKRVFTTAEDYQKAVEIKIYRGEGSLTIDNEFIGGFKVDEIPRRLKGEPQIEVTFELDVDGILTVTATVFSYSWYMEGVPHSMVFKDGVNKLTSREIYIQRQIIENYLKKDEKNREKSNIIEEFEKLIYTFDHVVQKKIKWLDQFSSSATNAELMEQLLDLQKSIQHIANIKDNIKNKKSSNINAKDIDIREELEKHVYTMRYIIQTNMDWFEINQHATWPELIFHKNIIDTFAKETVDSISLTELLIWREERNLNDRFEL